MTTTNFTPIGTLSLQETKPNYFVARRGHVVQGPWQWVINDALVAAAPIKPGEERVIKTKRGQIYRTNDTEQFWQLFPTDPSESPRLVPESYFKAYFAFVGKIADLHLYRKSRAQRAMQFFPTLEMPRLLVHPDNLPDSQSPYELSEGDWLVNLDDSYYRWQQEWAIKWIRPVDAAYQQNDCLITNPDTRKEWIARAKNLYDDRVQLSSSPQATILRGDGQDHTNEALICSETDTVIAPWLITTNLQLACLRQLSPEEHYRVVTPYGTVMESKCDAPHHIAWPPNNPGHIRILDQGATDNYHLVGRHGGFGKLWRKVVPTLAFQVTAEQFPEGIRVISKETPADNVPVAVPGDYVVYDGDGGFYHWKQAWANKNIEIFTV